jgi:hypothetical protein
MNGGKWRQEKHMGYLWTSVFYFSTTSKLVQIPVVTYDVILQALAVKGNILLPKPFLDSALLTVQPRFDPLGLSRVWQTEKASPRHAIST